MCTHTKRFLSIEAFFSTSRSPIKFVLFSQSPQIDRARAVKMVSVAESQISVLQSSNSSDSTRYFVPSNTLLVIIFAMTNPQQPGKGEGEGDGASQSPPRSSPPTQGEEGPVKCDEISASNVESLPDATASTNFRLSSTRVQQQHCHQSPTDETVAANLDTSAVEEHMQSTVSITVTLLLILMRYHFEK